MGGRRPTIDDVARHAGVGRTTVSRVLNNGPNVRPELRQRVLDSIDELGFQANVQARFLAGGISRTIAMVCESDPETEPNSYYQAALELGALRACAPHGLQLITHRLSSHDAQASARVLEMVEDNHCAGVILTPPFSDDAVLIGALVQQRRAVSCVSPAAADRQVPSIGIDDFAAGAELARYLLGLGHRRFGFITGLAGHVAAEQRFAGAMHAFADAGIGQDEVAVAPGNFTFTSGIEQLPELLGRTPRPSAVICANDDSAAGALFAAHRVGVRVPGDLSITGFDDTPVSQIVWPPLTTVNQPIKLFGSRAVEMIAEQLKGQEPGADVPHELLAHALVTRGSTGDVAGEA